MEVSYKKRLRVNFSVSVKGIVTPDITCELVDGTKEDVLKEAKELLDEAMKIAKEKTIGG